MMFTFSYVLRLYLTFEGLKLSDFAMSRTVFPCLYLTFEGLKPLVSDERGNRSKRLYLTFEGLKLSMG